MVPNSSGKPSAPRTPTLAFFASRLSDRLHGVISFHDEATPICGLRQSSSPMPTARSMPRAAARSTPSVTIELCGLRCCGGCGSVAHARKAVRATVHARGVATGATGPSECRSRVSGLPAARRWPTCCAVPAVLRRRRSRSPATAIEGVAGRGSAPRRVLLLVPVVAAVFIARTATVVDRQRHPRARGVRRRALPWNEIRGLSVSGRSVYAVCADGVGAAAVRAGRRTSPTVSRASDGHLPELAEPTPKFAPSRRRGASRASQA